MSIFVTRKHLRIHSTTCFKYGHLSLLHTLARIHALSRTNSRETLHKILPSLVEDVLCKAELVRCRCLAMKQVVEALVVHRLHQLCEATVVGLSPNVILCQGGCEGNMVTGEDSAICTANEPRGRRVSTESTAVILPNTKETSKVTSSSDISIINYLRMLQMQLLHKGKKLKGEAVSLEHNAVDWRCDTDFWLTWRWRRRC